MPKLSSSNWRKYHKHMRTKYRTFSLQEDEPVYNKENNEFQTARVYHGLLNEHLKASYL